MEEVDHIDNIPSSDDIKEGVRVLDGKSDTKEKNEVEHQTEGISVCNDDEMTEKLCEEIGAILRSEEIMKGSQIGQVADGILTV